jgi:UDP-glucose:(heptosyl)LPS alpha-1,3-glucosyltransferase
VHSLHSRKAYVVGVLSGMLAGVRTGVASFRDRPKADSRLFAYAGRLCGELVGSMVATSEEVRAALLRERWVPPGKTRIIPDGVNIARFESEGRRGPARAHWGIGDDVPVVGAVLESGREEELTLLSEAFAELRRSLPEARLLVCGLGLRGGDGHTIGLGPYADGPAFYAAIDALCVPRSSRVVPLTLLEGLAAGVPIAAARTAEDEGLAPEGPWAFALLTPADGASLGAGLVQLLSDREAARQLARGGRACVAENHSIDTWVERMQELYES